MVAGTSAGAQGCGVDQAKLVDARQIFGTSFAEHEGNRITEAVPPSACMDITETVGNRPEPRTKKATTRSGWMSCCSSPVAGAD
eukprot:COSAG02_NODE_19050_length_903_cov_1.029851_2_plen_84_part_00